MFLDDLLLNQYGKDLTNEILNNYKLNKYTTFRVNNILSDKVEVEKALTLNNINYTKLKYNDSCFIVNNKNDIINLDIYKQGKIYLQSISSMLPVWYLDLMPNQTLLDMCAAPGSKTTQIASIMNNNISITACEVNKIRALRLEYNLNTQQAKAFVINKSSLLLDDYMLFDNILLDAPCSGSGTFSSGIIPNTFSKDLVYNSSKTQTKLLDKAIKMLKPGNTMIYSTCSILDIENENVINNVLKKHTNVKILPIDVSNIDYIKVLPSKINGAVVVMPNEYYEGFFVCKLLKQKN